MINSKSRTIEKFQKWFKSNKIKVIKWLGLVVKLLSFFVLIAGIVSAAYAYKSTEDSDSAWYSAAAIKWTLVGSSMGFVSTFADWWLGNLRSEKTKLEKENSDKKIYELEKKLQEQQEQTVTMQKILTTIQKRQTKQKEKQE